MNAIAGMHKRIPDYGRHAGMNGVEYEDVRQVHTIAHVSEEQEEPCCQDRDVQRGEVSRQLEALYFVLVTKSVEEPSRSCRLRASRYATKAQFRIA